MEEAEGLTNRCILGLASRASAASSMAGSLSSLLQHGEGESGLGCCGSHDSPHLRSR